MTMWMGGGGLSSLRRMPPISYARHRHPPSVIQHSVRLTLCFMCPVSAYFALHSYHRSFDRLAADGEGLE